MFDMFAIFIALIIGTIVVMLLNRWRRFLGTSVGVTVVIICFVWGKIIITKDSEAVSILLTLILAIIWTAVGTFSYELLRYYKKD